jgi:pyridoxal phosphate enzyme (YggS family)
VIGAAEALSGNYAAVQREIWAAAERAGRDPAAIRLVAVTKGVPAERVRLAFSAGLRTFGENRVQEAVSKIDALADLDCEWHMVGHLQTNKVRFIEGRFTTLHSLDSEHLAEALDRRLTKSLDVLVEVNVAGERQKTGAVLEEAAAVVRTARDCTHLELRGLMTIAPEGDPAGAREAFRCLRRLRDRLQEEQGIPLPELSMGMSDDFQVAVEEGATMLRLGRALFGPRPAARREAAGAGFR